MELVRRRAWWYLVAFSVLLALFGLGDILGGVRVDPAIGEAVSGLTLDELKAESEAGYRLFDFVTRSQGVLLLVFGVVMTVILLVPYRAGRRWAWGLAWVLPAWAIAVAGLFLASGIVAGRPLPPPMISGPILGGIAMVVLLVDRARFVEAGPTPGDPGERATSRDAISAG